MSSGLRAVGSWLALLAELCKARVIMAVTLTTATGYLLAAGPDPGIWLPVLGVLVLAAGASALNQCQEVRLDARMKRTASRPLPSGRIDLGTALFISVLLLGFGFYLLASIEGDIAVLLGLGALAVVWYNGLYTYLKRVTAFSVVPGALVGAIPPVIGFVAGGGDPLDPMIMLVAVFFAIWQVPHFWLLLLLCGREYGKAGMPTLTAVFSERQLIRITFIWLLTTAVAGLFFPALAGDQISLPWKIGLVLVSGWLVARALAMLGPAAADDGARVFRRAFLNINFYALLVMICLCLNVVAGALA